jgi:hypothetical protein
VVPAGEVRLVDEIRTVQVLPAPWDLPFLHTRQAPLLLVIS